MTVAVTALVAGHAPSRRCLEAVRDLNLTDGWIGAGFVRNLVWDQLHGFEPGPWADVDVIYFDPSACSKDDEREIEAKLTRALPGVPWSVRNQARMHHKNDFQPFVSTADGLAHWVETATAVAVRLERAGTVALLAPYGLGDLYDLILRPTPPFATRTGVFARRVERKNWRARWPMLRLAE